MLLSEHPFYAIKLMNFLYLINLFIWEYKLIKINFSTFYISGIPKVAAASHISLGHSPA